MPERDQPGWLSLSERWNSGPTKPTCGKELFRVGADASSTRDLAQSERECDGISGRPRKLIPDQTPALRFGNPGRRRPGLHKLQHPPPGVEKNCQNSQAVRGCPCDCVSSVTPHASGNSASCHRNSHLQSFIAEIRGPSRLAHSCISEGACTAQELSL